MQLGLNSSWPREAYHSSSWYIYEAALYCRPIFPQLHNVTHSHTFALLPQRYEIVYEKEKDTFIHFFSECQCRQFSLWIYSIDIYVAAIGLKSMCATCTLSWCLVLRFSGFSQHRVERFRMAVAAMCAASASWENSWAPHELFPKVLCNLGLGGEVLGNGGLAVDEQRRQVNDVSNHNLYIFSRTCFHLLLKVLGELSPVCICGASTRLPNTWTSKLA